MYVYLYDKITKEARHQALLTSIETRLIEFGMNGKIEKLAVYKDVDRVIDQHVKKGARTLIAVGDDNTLRLAIQAAWRYNLVIGFIPLEKTAWSQVLRIPAGVEACEVLSKRLIRTMSIGLAKGTPILEECVFLATPDAWLRCDDQYTVAFTEPTECRIINESAHDIDDVTGNRMWRIEIKPIKKSRLRKRKNTCSTFFATTCMVGTSTTHIPLSIDQYTDLQSPCELTLYPQHTQIIVGKKIV